VRFKNYGLAPKSAADFAFLLHGFHFLKQDGVMAIILPHGVLFRGGAEERIRTKLLKDGHIDTVIGLPANLFYLHRHPGVHPGAEEVQEAGRRAVHQRRRALREGQAPEPAADEHIDKIIDTYQHRKEEARYSRGWAWKRKSRRTIST
jgi:type I restriction enzyme M protein